MTILNEDPSTKMLRSGFGKQVISDDVTDPAFGFGTSHRDAYQKMYLSPEQTKATAGNNSQGPVYKTMSAIGPQPESRYSSAPANGFGTSTRSIKYGKNNVPGPGTYVHEGGLGKMTESKRVTGERAVFGTSTRDQQSKVWLDEESMKVEAGKDTPGPNTYKTPNGVGKQADSKYSSLPAWKQGTAERFNEKDGTRDFPGAGTYGLGTKAHGNQTLSTKATLPTPKIGTSTRDGAGKIFISKEHEKSSYGKVSPGPTTASQINSFGEQTLSIKKTNPSFGFGTSKRSPGNDNGSPGPGSYYA